MDWVPQSAFLTKVAIDATAGQLSFDLAVDASGSGAPSRVQAGLDPVPFTTEAATGGRLLLVALFTIAALGSVWLATRPWTLPDPADGVTIAMRWVLGACRARVAVAGVGLGARVMGSQTTYEIDIRYSHYQPASLSVPVGVPVTFVASQRRPDRPRMDRRHAAVHAFHRTSDELLHSGLPTEVSIPATHGHDHDHVSRLPIRSVHLPPAWPRGLRMTGWLTIAG